MFKEYDVSGEEEEEELPVVSATVRLRSCPPVEGSSKAIVIDNITLTVNLFFFLSKLIKTITMS